VIDAQQVNGNHTVSPDGAEPRGAAVALPAHVAIIMDGNGRWAVSRGLPRILGHRAGAEAVRRVTEASRALGIRTLTLYAFSWENWSRPGDEVRELMGLLHEFILRELPTLQAQQIRLRAIGRLEQLPQPVREELQRVARATAGNDRMTLTLALSYGGRQELVDAMRAIGRAIAAGRLAPEQIDEALIGAHLYAPDLPDPDLVIRTSGEQRLSNFLLWEASYAELYMTPTLWPDFGRDELLDAIRVYQQRERRFGRTGPISDAHG
jgi:undecaprenyl diphosphate synthase